MSNLKSLKKKSYNEKLNREVLNILKEFREEYKDRKDLFKFTKNVEKALGHLVYFISCSRPIHYHVYKGVEPTLPYCEVLIRNHCGDEKIILGAEQMIEIFKVFRIAKSGNEAFGSAMKKAEEIFNKVEIGDY